MVIKYYTRDFFLRSLKERPISDVIIFGQIGGFLGMGWRILNSLVNVSKVQKSQHLLLISLSPSPAATTAAESIVKV